MSRLKFSFILLAWSIILGVGVGIYVLKHDPTRLTTFIVNQIADPESGLSLTLDQAEIQFFPQLKITLHQVLLRHEPYWQILAPQAELRPSLNIIHGKLDLYLQNPIVRIKTSAAENIAEPTPPRLNLLPLAAIALEGWPQDANLSLEQGQVIWLHNDQEVFRVLDLNLNTSLDNKSNYLQGQGRFLWENQDIPFNLHTDFTLQPKALQLKRISLDLDGNRLDLQGQIDLTTKQLQAKVDVAHLSLPRWLDFARQLPPGLTWALHQISGQAQLTLDSERLKLAGLTARIAGMTAKGELNFTWEPLKLEIVAHTPEALLNNIFPELVNHKAPTLKLPPPLPLPDDSSTPDLDYDLTFTSDQVQAWKLLGSMAQVQIIPSTPIIWTKPVKASPSPLKETLEAKQTKQNQTKSKHTAQVNQARQAKQTVQVNQAAQANQPAPDQKGTKLKLKLQLAEGKAEAQLNFPKTTSHVDLDLHLNQVRLEKLLKPLTAAPSLMGLGQMSFKGQATLYDSFLPFMASLKGNLSYEFKQGYIQLEKKYDFNKLSGQFIGQGQNYNSKQLTYTGSSSLSFDHTDQNFNLYFTGPIKLSAHTWLLQEAEGQLTNLQFNFPNLKGQAKAKLALDLPKNNLNLQNMQLDFTDSGRYASHLTGNFNVNLAGAEPYLSSNWQLQTSQPKTLASWLDLDLSGLAASSCLQLNAKGEFKGTKQNFKLSNLQGQLDATSFKGQLAYAKNTWQGNLHLGDLNLDTYLPPKSPKDSDPSPWPVEKLKVVDLDIFLFIKHLRLAKLVLTQAELPLKLKQGHLSLPWQSQFYGGQLNGALLLQPQGAGIWGEFQASAKNVQLLELTKQWSDETVVDGLARLKMASQGLLYSNADIPKALSGTWEFDLNNGYVTKSRAKNAPRTKINLLSATGSLQQGILSSKNLYFNGGGYSVKGQGQVDLITWQLYYNLLLTGYGLNNLPVTYSGSLGSPTTNIKLVDLFTGLFSGIGKGVFGLLEKTLKAPLQLF